MQEALMVAVLILAVVGASCLSLLCRLILIRIKREESEMKDAEDHRSQVERAPILDVIYAEDPHAH